MNKFGTSALPFSIIGLYWAFFHMGLAVLTVLLWRRGVIQGLKATVNEFKRRIQTRHKAILSASLSGWLVLGTFIFYNTNILNSYETKSEKELKLVDYERTYKSFEKMAQPEIISVHVEVDIFPETQSIRAKGILKYKNKTTEPIKQVLINIDKTMNIVDLTWSKAATLVKEDKRLEVKIFEFAQPISPGDEVFLTFSDSYLPKGFTNDEFQKKIVQNGSFFYGSDFVPIVGYLHDKELIEDKNRRKYGLVERPRMADVNDREALKKTYISSEGTWIDFEAIVSTSKDQTAIAPGYLVKEWLDNDRRYFHYRMDRPILNFYAFLSARYEVVRDKWNDVNIEVYHHPGHHADISRMINSVKKSLDYFTKNFSPYQFRQFRILEFPRYATFAQAFPNTIPYSESVGFIAKVRDGDPESIDFPFYVTSHEMAHQWWAHQVISGRLQGATMLSESLAQYSALMVQEKEYGPKQMKKFLKYELDKYLNGRSREAKKELPLALNENQQYIHYNKGSIVFYALKDYLGESVVNGVLRDFLKDFAYKGEPFPRAVELVERFRKAAPPDKKYLIRDLFETITFYDNRTDSVMVEKVGNKFKVSVKSHSKKIRSDELGRESEVSMNDFIDVGLFDEAGNIIYLEKHRLQSGENVIELEVDRKPAKGGVDPINKLIDKVSDDNLIKAVEVNP
ncbi:MAG: M1 family metallopeptidase [Pseudobdellovibrionaceae bacterium]